MTGSRREQFDGAAKQTWFRRMVGELRDESYAIGVYRRVNAASQVLRKSAAHTTSALN